jgi:diaminohydroxyphosphoribosylaminopyrimidine deaminase/5-amino-6-(5-phosphoribosylamino)uracil reductase
VIEQRLADRLILYVAPKIIGGDAPGLFASGVKTIAEAWEMQIDSVQRVGDDLRIEARPTTGPR